MPFKVSSAAFAVALCLAIAGCGNLPRPFSPASRSVSSTDALLPVDGAGVVVDAALCPVLADAVVDALRRREVPATLGPGNQGSMRLVCQAGDTGWLLISADNRRLGNITDDSPDSVAQSLLMLIGRAAPLRKDDQRPTLVVVPITGAPGDGATALSRAMVLALSIRGADIASEPDDETLLIMGSVVITDRDATSQFVEVIWELLSPDGARIGVVNQENTIDAGALDSAWGPIAPVIASAGADGLIDLIKQSNLP